MFLKIQRVDGGRGSLGRGLMASPKTLYLPNKKAPSVFTTIRPTIKSQKFSHYLNWKNRGRSSNRTIVIDVKGIFDFFLKRRKGYGKRNGKGKGKGGEGKKM